MKLAPAQTVAILSGDTLSAVFAIKGVRDMGVLVPTVTSCQAFLQVGTDPTSSSTFMRAFKPDGSGQFTWAVGAGQAALLAREIIGSFPYGRIETSVAQAAPRSL